MRFLVDAMLSTGVADALRAAGYDTAHVREYGLSRATDEQILARAREEGRIVLTADLDFGFLLTVHQSPLPSVILLRRLPSHNPSFVVSLFHANLAEIQQPLEEGSLVVIEERRIRVRRLPIGPQSES